MAKINTYSYQDPNANNVVRSAQGDSYAISALSFCDQGQAIRIYDGATEVLFSCYKVGTLNINGIGSISSSQPYDCINGGCVPKTTHNTPGVFANLAACQSGCARNSNCTGECVSASEIAALQQAANNLQSRNCK